MELSNLVSTRRGFLGGTLCGIAMSAGLSQLGRLSSLSASSTSSTETLFLTWQRDPTTTMTVQWIGASTPSAQSVIRYARLGDELLKSITPLQRPFPLTDLYVHRAELTQFAPGTEYQFQIGDSPAVHRFRTMPTKATNDFQFISGGDCGTNEHAIANNIIAAKQNPMFALIGGDLAYDNGAHRRLASSSFAITADT